MFRSSADRRPVKASGSGSQHAAYASQNTSATSFSVGGGGVADIAASPSRPSESPSRASTSASSGAAVKPPYERHASQPASTSHSGLKAHRRLASRFAASVRRTLATSDMLLDLQPDAAGAGASASTSRSQIATSPASLSTNVSYPYVEDARSGHVSNTSLSQTNSSHHEQTSLHQHSSASRHRSPHSLESEP
ncbi:hypothetical protein CBOM_06700, partial [Ceraceosorus bombacis]